MHTASVRKEFLVGIQESFIEVHRVNEHSPLVVCHLFEKQTVFHHSARFHILKENQGVFLSNKLMGVF
ncbi:MAG: hypothetical protein WBB70_11390, partial [Desulfobacterales bacterium]